MSAVTCPLSIEQRRLSAMQAMYHASVVMVRVGPNAQAFHIHKDLLCYWSKYFHSAFNGSFREANEKEITILDVQPRIFKIFMGWLYTQNLMLDKDIEDTLTPGDCHNVQSDETLVDDPCQNEKPLLCLRSVKDTDTISCSRTVINLKSLCSEIKQLFHTKVQPDDRLSRIRDILQEVIEDVGMQYTIIHNSAIKLWLQYLIHNHIDDLTASSVGLFKKTQELSMFILDMWGDISKSLDKDRHSTATNLRDADFANWSFSTLVDLYLFADKYDVLQLRVDSLDAIHKKNSSCVHFLPSIYAVSKALENLPSSSGLHRYFQDVYSHEWDLRGYTDAQLGEIEELLPKGFLLRVAVRNGSVLREFTTRKSPKPPYENGLCSYHDHHEKEYPST